MMRSEDTAIGDFADGFVSIYMVPDNAGNMDMEFNAWKAGKEVGIYCARNEGVTNGQCKR
jgi:hypothetical protein